MNGLMNVKSFIDILQNAVNNGIITENQKIEIEVNCAYIQKDKPQKFEETMIKILKDLNLYE